MSPALASRACDLSPKTLAKLVDVFYIGGTKNGALIGEAIVVVNPELQDHFRYNLRQRGGLLAKGRAVSLQFLELFRDDLYFEIARHANNLAAQLEAGINECGYQTLVEAPTNQVFPILPNPVVERLQQEYGFHVWEKFDEHNSAIRLVTSWATSENAVSEFLGTLRTCVQ